MTATRITVRGDSPYEVVIGTGVLSELPGLFKPGVRTVAVIHPASLPELSRPVCAALSEAGYDVVPLPVPDGERSLTALKHLLETFGETQGVGASGIDFFAVDGVADDFLYSSSGPAAVAGYPSVSVPAGFAGPQGALPVGVSFTGTGWADANLLDVAADFEDAAQARRSPGFLPTVGA